MSETLPPITAATAAAAADPDTEAEEEEDMVVGNVGAVLSIVADLHYRACGSPYMLPQSGRVSYPDRTRDPPGRKDRRVAAALHVKLTSADVALARWTADDLLDTVEDVEARAEFDASIGAARRAAFLGELIRTLDSYHLADPKTGADLFSWRTRGPLFLASLAKLPFVALTAAAEASMRAAVTAALHDSEGRSPFGHLMDNAAAVCVWFPATDVETTEDLATVIKALLPPLLVALRNDMGARRQLSLSEVKRLVCEYHVARVHDATPMLGSVDGAYVVPHIRLYVRLLPLYAYRMGAGHTLAYSEVRYCRRMSEAELKAMHRERHDAVCAAFAQTLTPLTQ